jgi:hypothetical protein
MVREQDVARMAALGIVAGIHPEHMLDDREISDIVWAGRTHRAFAFGDMARAGVHLRMGSDAPVSPLDPWLGISAAVHRTRDETPPWEPGNALDLGTALRSSWASPAVRAGVQGDVVALDADPSGMGFEELREMPVALTVLGGRITHEAMDA